MASVSQGLPMRPTLPPVSTALHNSENIFLDKSLTSHKSATHKKCLTHSIMMKVNTISHALTNTHYQLLPTVTSISRRQDLPYLPLSFARVLTHHGPHCMVLLPVFSRINVRIGRKHPLSDCFGSSNKH